MKIKLLIISFFFVVAINAQNKNLGNVTIKDLQENTHPIDSFAPAAILCKKARTYFVYKHDKGFSINHEYIYRIKIYKKEGLSWGNFSVPYRIGYENLDNDRIIFSDAVTYNLVDGKIEKTKIKNADVLILKKNEFWKEASIVLPNVKVGSVIEFKYIHYTERIMDFPEFGIQEKIPVNYAEYVTEIPLFFTYKSLYTGYLNVKSVAEVTSGYQNYTDEHAQTKSFTYNQLDCKYSAIDVPAIKEERYVNNIENYRTRILHELEKTSFPEQPVKDYSKTWEGVAKSIYADKNFGDELNKGLFFVDDLKKILMGIEGDYNKMQLVFDFVKNKLNWNNKRGVFSSQIIEKSYKEGVGNAAEINFILYNMLKMAGVEAAPVLISTKENGISIFPSITGFDNVIIAAETTQGRFLLDATDKLASVNALPLRDLNGSGRLIKENGTSEEVLLSPSTASVSNSFLTFKIEDSGKITGSLRTQKSDYEALTFREKTANRDAVNYIESLENELGGIVISDHKLINDNLELSKPVVETYNFTTNRFVESIGNTLFINPLLFFKLNQNPFSQEERLLPISMDYPKKQKINITVELPQGYEVESMPKPIKFATPENKVGFSLNIVNSGNIIQLVVINDINFTKVSADYYEVLKDFYQKVFEKQNEKIVLKKI